MVEKLTPEQGHIAEMVIMNLVTAARELLEGNDEWPMAHRANVLDTMPGIFKPALALVELREKNKLDEFDAGLRDLNALIRAFERIDGRARNTFGDAGVAILPYLESARAVAEMPSSTFLPNTSPKTLSEAALQHAREAAGRA